MKKLLCILLILMLLFIWGQSLMPVSVSATESQTVTDFLRPVLEIFLGAGRVNDALVRKLAHFAEFFTFGLIASALSRYLWRSAVRRLSMPLAFGLATALFDETWQIFSGRGPLVQDIWLDFAGFFTATLLFVLISALIQYLKEKKRRFY